MKNKHVWPEFITCTVIAVACLGFLRAALWIPPMVASIWEGTPTATPIPTNTPLPPAGKIYMKVPVEGIAQLDSFSNETFSGNPILAQMIVVVKETSATAGGSMVTRHRSERFCVEVGAFLDENGLRTTRYDQETAKHALLILKTEDLARYGEALPDQVQTYLVPDSACQ